MASTTRRPCPRAREDCPVARPEDAIYFRESFGKILRGRWGWVQAYYVAPITVQQTDDEKDEIIRQIQASLVGAIDYSDTFYISPDIGTLLQGASARLTEEHIFHFEPQDFPSLTGMMYLDFPLAV